MSAWQGFLGGLKTYWGGELYREVVAKAGQVQAADTAALEREMRSDPAYRLYGWLERRIQQFKWGGRYGFVTMAREQFAANDPLAGCEPGEGLALDPSLPLPDYVRETETHQQPGGLWKDLINAYALAWYATGLSFSGTNPDELVDWYGRLIRDACAAQGLKPRRVLDLGCTGGRSTRAIERALRPVVPEVELFGLDVCEGALRHGRQRAIEEGSTIRLLQQSAERLSSFTDASVDVVSSHWLYHEMPPAAIRNSIAEARRVLRTGGLFAMYDMLLVPGGRVGRWLQSGYAARNNEPFTHTLMDIDFKAELEHAGFTDVSIRLTSPQYADPGVPDTLPAQRLHYMTLVTARVPRA